MSNEELVAEIQAGAHERTEQLWNQVEGLVKWKARRVQAASGVAFEDLYQCGYIALVAAIARYKPENGAFSTCFVNALRTAFAEETGIRTKTQALDPLRRAVSLDMPTGEEATSTLSELIPDPAAEAKMNAVAEQEDRRRLCEALDTLLRELPANEKEAIARMYYQGQSVLEAAEAMGISVKEVKKLESNAIRYLRHPERSKKLRLIWGR